MIEFISQPWPWYVAGPLIALVLFTLLKFGQTFGLSSNLTTMCSVLGAAKLSDYFKLDIKDKLWNIIFIIGAMLGGFIASQYLTGSEEIALNPDTVAELKSIGFYSAGEQYLPPEIFSPEQLKSVSGIAILLVGGFLIGFGSRYAGGCTSGHAITGLSNLQLPSLIAVVGFFIGGLIMVNFLIPIIF